MSQSEDQPTQTDATVPPSRPSKKGAAPQHDYVAEWEAINGTPPETPLTKEDLIAQEIREHTPIAGTPYGGLNFPTSRPRGQRDYITEWEAIHGKPQNGLAAEDDAASTTAPPVPLPNKVRISAGVLLVVAVVGLISARFCKAVGNMELVAPLTIISAAAFIAALIVLASWKKRNKG